MGPINYGTLDERCVSRRVVKARIRMHVAGFACGGFVNARQRRGDARIADDGNLTHTATVESYDPSATPWRVGTTLSRGEPCEKLFDKRLAIPRAHLRRPNDRRPPADAPPPAARRRRIDPGSRGEKHQSRMPQMSAAGRSANVGSPCSMAASVCHVGWCGPSGISCTKP